MMNLTANDIVLIAGFAISVIAAAAASLVVQSAGHRTVLLVAILAVVGTATLFFVRSRRTTDAVIRARVSEEVARQRRNDNEFELAVQREVQKRVSEEQARREAIDQQASGRIARAEAERRVREEAFYETDARRRAADSIALAEHSRATREARARLTAVHRNLIGTWQRPSFGSRLVATFRGDGTCDYQLYDAPGVPNPFWQDPWIRCVVTAENRLRAETALGAEYFAIDATRGDSLLMGPTRGFLTFATMFWFNRVADSGP